ncbi:uncharacterized protein LOC124138192 [Haliotis rufescens]|uniref:uncharacterized protein LOC124138192 n=1 Tax=Haliotis rufescens TaxID=6454 RepID=UPI001EAFA132|nr:uncharacterized protein LOC124138192 [Haliotis rufescens]
MQTYGRQWRGNSSACAPGHVSWSNAKPLLRLDSTGEVSSVDHTSQRDKAQLASTPRSDSSFKMKNWVTNKRFFNVNNSLTGANNFANSKTNTNFECTQNMFECFTGDLLSERAADKMNPKTPHQKFQKPQCGISGWNYNGQGLRGVNTAAFAVFPCHQFSNSFNAGYYPFHGQGNMGVFNVCQFVNGFSSQVDQIEDRFWNQRQRKQERCHRGHSPKHQKREHSKIDSTTSLSEDVVSPSSSIEMKHGKTQSEDISKHSNDAMKKHTQQSVPKSKQVDSRNMDIIDQCKIQVKPEDCVSSILDDHDEDNKNTGEKTDSRENSVSDNSVKRGKVSGLEVGAQELRQPLVRPEINKNEESLPSKVDDMNSNNEKGRDSAAKDSNIHVLFIRKNRKKGRPSSRKQRRRKILKARSASSCNGPDTQSCSETCVDDCEDDLPHKLRDASKDMQSKRCASVSFVLGLMPSPASPKVPNGSSSEYTFCFNDNDSDNGDWDEEDEDEIDFGPFQGTFSQCDLLNFLPKSKKTEPSPINFQVHISPLQSCGDGDKTLEDINASWNIHISLKEGSPENLKKSKKKVHFPDDKDLKVVHPMIHWSYAYQAARKGHWENYVRDRDRFKRRTQDVETVVVPVLDSKHRQCVYEERFKTEKH